MTGKTISLVLGSGGARGLAHIGVIQWLTEQGYEIRSIAGASMGAVVGGIYAAGKLDVYANWVCGLQRMDVLRLLDPTLGQAGLIKGQRILEALRTLIGDRAIEELPISFTAVATELDSGKEVWLQQGSLFDALRASFSTPLVFTPWARDGRTLVDGAVVNPIPIAPTLSDHTDLTIAVVLNGADVEPPPTAAKAGPAANAGALQRIGHWLRGLLPGADHGSPLGKLDVAFAAMDNMQNTIARLKLATYSPDVTVEIPRNACGYLEFWRAPELIGLGRERMAAALSGHRRA